MHVDNISSQVSCECEVNSLTDISVRVDTVCKVRMQTTNFKITVCKLLIEWSQL
jgi:hypothetical protein